MNIKKVDEFLYEKKNNKFKTPLKNNKNIIQKTLKKEIFQLKK